MLIFYYKTLRGFISYLGLWSIVNSFWYTVWGRGPLNSFVYGCAIVPALFIENTILCWTALVSLLKSFDCKCEDLFLDTQFCSTALHGVCYNILYWLLHSYNKLLTLYLMNLLNIFTSSNDFGRTFLDCI